MSFTLGPVRRYGLAAVAAGFMAVSSTTSAQDWPDAGEAKAIAGEGYIYGVPIVMNCLAMYEYAVDRDSGQFKAPFNEITNEAR